MNGEAETGAICTTRGTSVALEISSTREISTTRETRKAKEAGKAGPRRRDLMAAWQQLHTSGTASPASAHILRIGLEPFLASFSARFLGEEGLAQGMKLLLGGNGEGKTHFLYCLREMALARGHAVSLSLIHI